MSEQDERKYAIQISTLTYLPSVPKFKSHKIKSIIRVNTSIPLVCFQKKLKKISMCLWG